VSQFNSQSQHRCAPVALRIVQSNSQSPQHHSAQGISNNTTHRNDQQTGQSEAKPGLRRGQPMGRSSKDTMESPYSARLPSSLSWRQNREDTSSSGNGRRAAPVTSQSGSRFAWTPLRTFSAVASGLHVRDEFAERPGRSEVAIAGQTVRENSQSDPSAAKSRLWEAPRSCDCGERRV
jgi:hypothetical protein